MPTEQADVIASTGYIRLATGATGDAVTRLQKALKSRGYYTGAVDGRYGDATTQAVVNFQRAYDLRVDGVAGPAMQRVLYGTTPSITYSPLYRGDTSDAVRNLQYTLYELGYFDMNMTGFYGQLTSEAVQAFQLRNGLPVNGDVASNATLQALYSAKAISSIAADLDFTPLKYGDQGEDVLGMKNALYQLGYPVSLDNNDYDDETREAVKLFQKLNKLNVTGNANANTLRRLYSEDAVGYYE